MKIEIELQPVRTPNFILQKVEPQSRQDGFQEPPAYAVKDLEAQTISELCDQFRKDMFAKAGKTDPREEENTK